MSERKGKGEYAAKYKDPRWQRKKNGVLERDEYVCQKCGDGEETLHVHHRYYRWGNDPWDYPDDALITLCEPCHEEETELRTPARDMLVECLFVHLLAEDVIRFVDALEYAFQQERPELVTTSLQHFLSQPEWVHRTVADWMADATKRRSASPDA